MIAWPWTWAKIENGNETFLVRKKEISYIKLNEKELKVRLKDSTELSWTKGE